MWVEMFGEVFKQEWKTIYIYKQIHQAGKMPSLTVCFD